MDIYQELIMDHARSPRNVGKVKGALKIRAANPLCGDEAEIFLKIDMGKITDIKYQIQGCILSRAAMSILSEEIKGKKFQSLKDFKDEKVFELIGARPSPSRQNCALFVFEALKGLAVKLKTR